MNTMVGLGAPDVTKEVVKAGASQVPDMVVGGTTVPGASIAAAGYEFARNPSAEAAANAAMQVACVAATSGVASMACGLLTVDNIGAVGGKIADWADDVGRSITNALKNAGILPDDRVSCFSRFIPTQRQVEDQILTLDTSLYKTWYATRSGLGLPFKDCEASPVYVSPCIDPHGECRSLASGKSIWLRASLEALCIGKIAQTGKCERRGAPELVGYRTKALNEFLSKDPVWNDWGLWGKRFAGSKGNRWIHIFPGSTGWETSPMPKDCGKYVAMVTSAFAELLVRTRLDPVRRGVQAVLKQWGEDFDREKAELDEFKRRFAEGMRKRTERAKRQAELRAGLQRWMDSRQRRQIKRPRLAPRAHGQSSWLLPVVAAAFGAGAILAVSRNRSE